MSLFKNTSITENTSLQLQLEGFNTFNRVQLAGPDTYLPDTTFGVESSVANPGRILRMAAKIIW